jgi:UDP-N-acetylglucosamine--N-acetylmuramyl-(pentapeptide) pyrophosphoryl-undecaprenol N-acetylglucosamine transferase
MSTGTRLMIAGGGTGGHLFPGVAVAEELKRREPGSEVLFVGTTRGIESRVLPDLGWALEHIEVSGLKTVGLTGAMRGALRVPGALLQSRRIIKAFAPDVVIGVGGYASGPVVLAARLMGIPTAILEQNSIPGLTNRILGKVARRIFLSFSHTRQFFKARKSELVGNPIRQQILAGLQDEDAASSRDKAPLRLFVFGGSQGAVSVNAMCCAAAALLREQGIELEIVHQTGKADLEATRARYQEAQIEADCRAFIDDMASEYKAADLIVSRAGATTIAELGIVGRPAVLIPYPHAANNHQELNAQEMVEAGAALMLRQKDNEDGQALAAMLAELCRDEDKRRAMAAAMRSLGRADAAAKVVDWAVSRS